MRNAWKTLIVVVLAVAVAAILAGKRNGASTTPTPSSPGSRETATQSATASSQTPATAPARAAASPSPKQAAAPQKPASAPAGVAASPARGPAPTSPSRPKPIQNAQPVALPQMIELGSETCIPCQKMQPILEELRKEYKGQLEVPFWDVYEHPEKAKEYRIRVIPTQVFVGADGKELFRHEGFYPKEEIVAKFRELGIELRPLETPSQEPRR